MSIPQIPDPADNIKEFLGIDDDVMGLVFDAAVGEVPGFGSFVDVIGTLNGIIGAFNTISDLLSGDRKPLIYTGTFAGEDLSSADSDVTVYDVLGNPFSLIDALVGRPFIMRGMGGNDRVTIGADGLFGWGDILDGGSGDDTMAGGKGGDTYHVDSAADVIIEHSFEGTDTVILSAASYTLPGEVDNLLVDRNVWASVTGNAWDNKLVGNNGNDALRGEGGRDTLAGGEGNDTLDGGSDTDTMIGGTGNDDYYLSDTSDRVQENENEGFDRVFTPFSFSLKVNTDRYNLLNTVEGLILLGAGNFDATGNDLSNDLQGNSGNNTARGFLGNDTLQGWGGDDRLIGDEGNDSLDGGTGNDFLQGGDGNDTLRSGGGTIRFDVLQSDGSYKHEGGDTLRGGVGDDTYYVQDGTLSVSEAGDSTTDAGGYDKIYTASAWTLARNGQIFEELILEGTANLIGKAGSGNNKLTGNSGDNELYAWEGADTLIGGHGSDKLVGDGGDYLVGDGVDTVAGATYNDTLVGYAGDTLEGGQGDDVYLLKEQNILIVEALSRGTDTVHVYAGNLTLTDAQEIEYVFLKGDDSVESVANSATQKNLAVTGNAVSQQIYGDKGKNVIKGMGGNDRLWGDDGLDTLEGGAGNDTLIGSYGNDSVQGGSLKGGAGDDLYMVYSTTDVLEELASEGTDQVSAFISFTLPANFENLDIYHAYVEGVTRSATGNALNNKISGTRGNDVLDGAGGADTLRGGAGDDVYVVDNAGDLVIETYTDFMVFANGTWSSHGSYFFAGGGQDTVKSSITYTLPNDIERLELTGTANINGTGNDQHNYIKGNSGNNVLDGGSDGWFYRDTLEGGAGDDTYYVDVVEATRSNGSRYVISDMVIEDGGGIDKVIIRGSLLFASYLIPEGIELIEFETESGVNLKGTGANENITGSNGSDIIYGLGGHDTLDGGGSEDILIGGPGNDTYYVQGTFDFVIETGGSSYSGGIDTVYSKTSYSLITPEIDTSVLHPDDIQVYTRDVENLILQDTVDGGNGLEAQGNALANRLEGNSLNNILRGADGNDTLIGGSGFDTLYGGLHGDLLQGGDGDDYLDGENHNDILEGGAGDDTLIGYLDHDTLHGGTGNDSLDAGDGTDLLFGDEGNDTLLGSTGKDVLYGGEDDDSLYGGDDRDSLSGDAGNDRLFGDESNDTLNGGDGNDTLDGGVGIDSMTGGAGNDTYILDRAPNAEHPENPVDIVVEAADGGTDTVVLSVNGRLADFANIENLTLTGTARLATGNAGNNVLTGNAGNNILDGGEGADTMIGGGGFDIYVIDNAGDVAQGSGAIETPFATTLTASMPAEIRLTGTDAVNATGDTRTNTLRGNSAANVLDPVGGTGNQMWGGDGNDTYYQRSASDTFFELAGGGVDTLYSPFGIDMSALVTAIYPSGVGQLYENGWGIENVIITSEAAVNVTGNWVRNYIRANNNDNVLDGGDGVDTLVGGAGDDTYITDGLDSIDEVDDFNASTPADFLNGAGGYDKMELYLPSSGDFSRTVLVAQGVEDLYVRRFSYTIVDSIVPGIRNLNYAGNDLDNRIEIGVETLNGKQLKSNDRIDGGKGADTMLGGVGDDTYIVDDAGDVVIEERVFEFDSTLGQNVDVGGHDTVYSSVSFSLADNGGATGSFAEDLILRDATGTNNGLNGTGNFLSNRIQGTLGNNVLDGGAGGDDTLVGVGGADIFIVRDDNGTPGFGDVVQEGVDAAIDLVQSYATYWSLLSSGVENLSFMSSGANTGVGNAQNNEITGNTGNDSLSGATGNDTLIGGDGKDTLLGGDGTDDLRGGSGNDSLAGGVGNDTLDGGAGSDTLAGSEDNDLYRVDDSTDVVIENASEGNDTVESSAATYTLGAHVETLTLITGGVSGFGNAQNNTVTGNSGNNTLGGGAGVDTVNGGGGDDILVYDSDDTLIGGTGTDTLRIDGSDVALDLNGLAGANLQGLEQIDLTGSGNNRLKANASQIAAMSTESDVVRVLGNAGDAVMLDGPWTFEGSVSGYARWTSDSNDAELLVQSGVAVVVPVAEFSVDELDGSNGFMLWSDAALNPTSSDGEDGGDSEADRFGASVSIVGDINGDGFDDLVVGAPYTNVIAPDGSVYNYDYEEGVTPVPPDLSEFDQYLVEHAGGVYVVFGGASGFAASTEVHSLSPERGLSVKGDGANLRYEVYDEYDPPFVYWEADTEANRAGTSVSGVGDINGDGFTDFLIGAPNSGNLYVWSDPNFGGFNRYLKQGAGYLVFGGDGGMTTSFGGTALDGSNGASLLPEEFGGDIGTSVAGIGDFNGDGLDDLVLGAPYFSETYHRQGGAFIVFGSDAGAANIDLMGLDGDDGFRFLSSESSIKLGRQVGAAGDVNGDGFDDLIVAGAMGKTHVILGSAEGPGAVLDAVDMDDSTGFSFNAENGMVASGGDFNGDGFDDLLFGSYRGQNGAALLFGSANNDGLKYVQNTVIEDGYGGWSPGTAALSSYSGGDGTHGFFISQTPYGEYDYSDFTGAGFSVASAGDVNGDGYDDIVIGAPYASVDGLDYTGAVYVVFGKAEGIGSDFVLTELDGVNGFRVVGDTAYAHLGTSVSGGGDINGDGFDDIVIGAEGDSYYGVSGQSYVIFGRNFNGAAALMGTAGSDTLTASGAAAVVRGGSGNDVIKITSTDFFRLDGGNGTDTLQLTGSGMNLDFQALQANALRGIEVFDLTGSGANSLTIGMLDAIDLVASGGVLTIHGNTGDEVHLLDNPVKVVGVSFDTYQYEYFSIQVDKAISVSVDG